MLKFLGNSADILVPFLQNLKRRSDLRRLLTGILCWFLIVFSSHGQSTFCGDVTEFQIGSCIIDMGVMPQTDNNGLKPYGLLYDLVMTGVKVPVYWSINTGKGKDGTDFTVDGINFRGGPFIIPAEDVPAAQARINTWVGRGVVVHYATQPFSPPIYDLISYLPRVVLDSQTGNLIQAAFYTRAQIPSSAYLLGGIPSLITSCDDIYVLPHADPQNWPASERNLLYNFINMGGWFFAACHAVGEIENTTGGTPAVPLTFLSQAGLVPYKDPTPVNPTPPYTYTSHGNPFMQFVGTLNGALNSGSQRIFLPKAPGWRGSTTVSIFDPDYLVGNYSSPGPATLLAYGPAYGNSSNGTVMYMAGHTFQAGTVAENVAAARVYGNFWIRSGIGTRPTISGPGPMTVNPGQIVNFSASASHPRFSSFTWQWSADLGGTFSSPTSSSTDFTVPVVAVPTDEIIQIKVTTNCNRVAYYCFTLTIIPVSTDNFIQAPQTICTGQTPAPLTGNIPAGGADSFLWESSTTGPASGFANAAGTNNLQDYTPGPLAVTTWYRRRVTTGGVPSWSASIEITVRPLPTIVASATPTTLCSLGQSTSLSSTGSSGANFIYSWSSNPVGFSSNLQNPGTVTPAVTTTYTATVTDLLTGCSATSSVLITVNAPFCSITGLDNVCPGSSNVYTAPAGMVIYSWAVPVGNATIPGLRNQRNVTVIAGSNCSLPYTLTLTLFNGSCWSVCSATYYVNDTEPPTFSGTLTPINIVSCDISALPGPLTVAQLRTAGATISDVCSALDNQLTVLYTDSPPSGTGPVVITRTYTIRDLCGNVSEPLVQDINFTGTQAAPTASVTEQPTCAVATGTITVTAPANGPTITYTVTGTNPVVAPVTNSTGIFTGLTPGDYDVTVADGFCLSPASPLTVIAVAGAPTASITPDPSVLCADGSLNMDGNPTGGSGTYTAHLWTGTGAAYLSDPNIQNPVFSGAPSGTYDLTYTVTDSNVCNGTDNLTVTVNPIPITSPIYHP